MSTPVQKFNPQAEILTHDLRHRVLIQTALGKYEVIRAKSQSLFEDLGVARQAATETRRGIIPVA